MRRVGPYELTQKLGSGGMAEVWMGRRTAMGGASKSVAVKLLASQHLGKPDYRQMFMDEARLSMLLTNSNIVQVFDIGEEPDGTAYMAMEWIDGCDLADLTSRLREHGQRLSDEVISFIIGEILRALRYAHELTHQGQGSTVVHRDISPQNVMLSVSGEVKLMDFGVARISADETSGQFVKGKLRYMPPEQLKGNSREPTVDLFAVGAVLHELLDGQKFRSVAADEGELYGMILSGTHPPLTVDPRDIPIELDQLRWGLLAARVEDRLPSARAALGRLRKFARYRDASMELEELVRWAVGAHAPRTGLAEPAAKPETGTVVLHQSAIWGEGHAQGQGYGHAQEQGQGWGSENATGRATPSELHDVHQGHGHGHGHDATGADQRPMVGGEHTGSDPRIPGTDAERPVSRAHAAVVVPGAAEDEDERNTLMTVILPVLLVVVGLGFGLFAAGALFGWFDKDKDAGKDEVAEGEAKDSAADPAGAATPDDVAEIPPAPPGAADAADAADAGEVIQDATDDPQPLVEDDEAPVALPNEEVEDIGGSKPAPGPDKGGTTRGGATKGGSKTKGSKTKKPKDSGPTVDVTLVTSAYDSVDVKIGGTRATLEGKKVVKIPPGSYTISLRQGDADWKSAGKLNVEAGKSYEVKLLKPPLAMVKTK